MRTEVDVFPPDIVAAGKKLRDYRVMELGITLGAAARILEVTTSEYSSLEHGRVTADLDEVRRVLKDGKQLKDSGARTGRFQGR
jgi:predicted transcriptional regulator